MATARDVKFTLSAEDRVSRVVAGVRSSLGGLGDRVEGLSAGFGGLARGIAPLFGGALFLQFVRSTANGIDALNDLKDATGSSIENLSALEDVARRNGNTLDDVSGTLVKFNQVLADAKPGNAAANTLKAIGLNAAELRQLDPAEALQRTAIALQGFADDGNKARIVQELFGKSVREAAPFLKDLAEAGRLQGTVTTKQAEEAEKFNKQLAALQKNSTDLARDLVSKLLPALNQVAVELKAGQQVFGGFFSTLFNVNPATAFANAAEGVDFYNDKLRQLQRTREILAKDPNPVARRGGLIDADAEIEQVKKLLEYYQRVASALGQVGAGAGRGLTDPRPDAPSAPEVPDKPAEQVTAYQRLIDKIRERTVLGREELEQGRQLSESDRLGLQLVLEIADAKNKLTIAEKRTASASLEELLAVVRSNEARELQAKLEAEALRAREAGSRLSERLLAEITQEANARIANNQALRDEVAAIGLTWEGLQQLRLARLDDAIATEQMTLAQALNAEASADEIAAREQNIRLLQQEAALIVEAAAKRKAAAEDPSAGVRRAVDAYIADANAVGDNLERLVGRTTASLEDSLTGLLSGQRTGFRQLVNDTIAEITRLYVVKPLLASIFGDASRSGGFGQLLGLFGTIGSLASGSYNADYSNEGRNYTTPSAVGGTRATASGAPAVTVIQNNTFGAGVSPSQLSQALARAKEEAKGEIRDAIRRGSSSYS